MRKEKILIYQKFKLILVQKNKKITKTVIGICKIQTKINNIMELIFTIVTIIKDSNIEIYFHHQIISKFILIFG